MMLLAPLLLMALLEGADVTTAASVLPSLSDGVTTAEPVEVVPDGPLTPPAWVQPSSATGAVLD